MTNNLYRITGALGMTRLFEHLNRHRPTVLAFHGVTTDERGGGICNHQGKHLHASIFERLMTLIARRYNPVSLSRIADWIAGGEQLPANAVAITFDDGYRNVATNAAPVLHRLGVPATLFVATDFAFEDKLLWTDRLISALALAESDSITVETGAHLTTIPLRTPADRIAADAMIRAAVKKLPEIVGRPFLDNIMDQLKVDEDRIRLAWADHLPVTADDLSRLPEMGVAIGSHTCSHAIVSRLSEERMVDELERSKRTIEAATGERCDQFSYPNGAPGDFNDDTRRRVIAAGYRCAVTTVKDRVDREYDRYEIPRYLLTHNRITTAEFAAEVSGYPTFLRNFKSLIARP